MATRFVFPPVNLMAPVEPQMTYRADWVGYRLIRIQSDGNGIRWKLANKDAFYIFESLCEVDMKLAAILEEIGDRVEKEQLQRMLAARIANEQARALLKQSEVQS